MNYRLLIVAIFALSSLAAAQPKDNGLDVNAAAEYSRKHNGVALLVLKGDKILFEDYPTIGGKDLPWAIASGTKSFVGVMCAAAIEDGLISGFDEKVADTITEWRPDPRKAKITVRQLLSLTSGIEAGQIGAVPSYSEAVSYPARHEPGTHFEYGPVPFQIFGEVMTRKLAPRKETVDGYLKRRILEPLGIDVTMWRKKDAQPMLPQGVLLTAREWVKFGQFLRDGGKWKGKQIVAAKYLSELTKGSKTNPAYGITFWLNADGSGPGGGERRRLSGEKLGEKVSAAATDIYMAAGAGNQRLYIIPSKDLVVVRFGIFGDYDDREFISRLISNKPR